MAKSIAAFRRSSPKFLPPSKPTSVLSYLPMRTSQERLALPHPRWHPPVKTSLKQSPLPHPPKPPDPPDSPDFPLPLSQRFGSYLVSTPPLAYYCAKDPSSPLLGFVSPDGRFSPASLEVCLLPTTIAACYCVNAHSPLSPGLFLPDRKSPPTYSETYLLPTTAISVTSPTLLLPQVVSSSPSDSPELDLYQLREEFVELGLKVRVTRLSLMVLMACVPFCGSVTALVRIFVVAVYCRIYTKPDLELISLYTDDTWVKENPLSSFAWFSKNAGKETIRQGSGSRHNVPSALSAEALALKESLETAISLEYRKLICHSDCPELDRVLNTQASSTEIYKVLEDIRKFQTSFDVISFCYVPRNENTEAETLAKAALLLCSHPSLEEV